MRRPRLAVTALAHAWVDVTYLEQEDFDRLVTERKARQVSGRSPSQND
jgi:hypothetical protein